MMAFLSGLFRSASIVAAVGSSSTRGSFAPSRRFLYTQSTAMFQYLTHFRIYLLRNVLKLYSWISSGNPGSLPSHNSISRTGSVYCRSCEYRRIRPETYFLSEGRSWRIVPEKRSRKEYKSIPAHEISQLLGYGALHTGP